MNKRKEKKRKEKKEKKKVHEEIHYVISFFIFFLMGDEHNHLKNTTLTISPSTSSPSISVNDPLYNSSSLFNQVAVVSHNVSYG